MDKQLGWTHRHTHRATMLTGQFQNLSGLCKPTVQNVFTAMCNWLVGWVKLSREAITLHYDAPLYVSVHVCVGVLLVKLQHESELAWSADRFQIPKHKRHGQTRAGTTLGMTVLEFRGRRYWELVEGEDHRLNKLCVSVGLSNYRLAWCVEPKVYHNIAQGMTPYTTCIYANAYTQQQLPYKAFKQLLRILSLQNHKHCTSVHTFWATQWYTMIWTVAQGGFISKRYANMNETHMQVQAITFSLFLLPRTTPTNYIF